MTINIDTTLPILFMFLLLILAVGYFIVEIIDWENYHFRQSLNRYENSLLDRILHYSIWWIVANIAILIFELFFRWGQLMLIDVFNNSGNISNSIIWNNIDKTWIQIIVFTIFYFFYLIILLTFFWVWNPFLKFIFSKVWIIRKKFQSIKWNTQDKNKK